MHNVDLSAAFFRSIVDSIEQNIAIIDHNGDICFVNASWSKFGRENSAGHGTRWLGLNYLKICERAAVNGDEYAEQAGQGIGQLIDGRRDYFEMEYPCDSPTERRWFLLAVTRLDWQDGLYLVISHRNITDRKLAEEAAERLALTDGLTLLANRRHFNQFLDRQWRSTMRGKRPVSMLMVDVDYFKLYNDLRGHLAGDECLRKIAACIGSFSQRPDDLAARFGGEEFALVLGDTDERHALDLAERVLAAIRRLKIPHGASPIGPFVSASIGVATCWPRIEERESMLVDAADKMLYAAKRQGRDRVLQMDDTAPLPVRRQASSPAAGATAEDSGNHLASIRGAGR